jgi:hypothetical protein
LGHVTWLQRRRAGRISMGPWTLVFIGKRGEEVEVKNNEYCLI